MQKHIQTATTYNQYKHIHKHSDVYGGSTPALLAFLCFLTFTEALTVVNTQWRDPFTCVSMF